jgi:hypothetical protein
VAFQHILLFRCCSVPGKISNLDLGMDDSFEKGRRRTQGGCAKTGSRRTARRFYLRQPTTWANRMTAAPSNLSARLRTDKRRQTTDKAYQLPSHHSQSLIPSCQSFVPIAMTTRTIVSEAHLQVHAIGPHPPSERPISHSSLLPRRQAPPQSEQTSSELSRMDDSGYASQSSSPVSKQQKNADVTQMPQNIASGKNLQSPKDVTNTSGGAVAVPGHQRLPQRHRLTLRRTIKLKCFPEIVIKPTELQRYGDLMELFNKPEKGLCEAMERDRWPGALLSIKLKVLGVNKATAKPWIVVLCDKVLSKGIRRFFKQAWVKKEC